MSRIGKRKPETPEVLENTDNLEGLDYLDRLRESDKKGKDKKRKKIELPFGKASKKGRKGEPAEPHKKTRTGKVSEQVTAAQIKAIPAEIIEEMPAIKTDDEGRPIGPNKKPMRLRRRLKPKKPGLFSTLLPIIGLLIGAVVLAWPIISDIYQSFVYDGKISSVEQAYNYDEPEYQAMLEQADLYNKSLAGQLPPGTDPSTILSYKEQLNYNESGMMSWVEIPILSMKLPIYHGADEEALMAGVGHLEGTSLPVGGDHTKCCISGHSGMQNERMFDSIGDLKEGDTVIIHTLSRELYYEVESQEVVLPTALDKLKIDNEDSELILITCTPYGVNTHRRLVHCKQVDHKPAEPSPIAKVGKYMMGRNAIAFVGLCVVLILAFLWFMFGGARKKQKEAEAKEKKRMDDGKKQAEALLVIQLKNEFDDKDDTFKTKEAKARKSRWISDRNPELKEKIEEAEKQEAQEAAEKAQQETPGMPDYFQQAAGNQDWMKEFQMPTMPMMNMMPVMPMYQAMPAMPTMTTMPPVQSAPAGMGAISVMIDPALVANHSVHLMLENGGEAGETDAPVTTTRKGPKSAEVVESTEETTEKPEPTDTRNAHSAEGGHDSEKDETAGGRGEMAEPVQDSPEKPVVKNTGNTQRLQIAQLTKSLAALQGVVEHLVAEMEEQKETRKVEAPLEEQADTKVEPKEGADDEKKETGDEIGATALVDGGKAEIIPVPDDDTRKEVANVVARILSEEEWSPENDEDTEGFDESTLDELWDGAPEILELLEAYGPRGEDRIYEQLMEDAPSAAPNVIHMFEQIIEEEEREAEAQRVFDELIQTPYGPITVKVLDKILREVNSEGTENAEMDDIDERDSFFIAADLLNGLNQQSDTNEETKKEDIPAEDVEIPEAVGTVDAVNTVDADAGKTEEEEEVRDSVDELEAFLNAPMKKSSAIFSEEPKQVKRTMPRGIRIPTRRSKKAQRKGWTNNQKPSGLGNFGKAQRIGKSRGNR